LFPCEGRSIQPDYIFARLAASDYQKVKDRIAMNTRESFGTANAATFDKVRHNSQCLAFGQP
jgi:hypothetical protein